jgi:hypothetical protein
MNPEADQSCILGNIPNPSQCHKMRLNGDMYRFREQRVPTSSHQDRSRLLLEPGTRSEEELSLLRGHRRKSPPIVNQTCRARASQDMDLGGDPAIFPQSHLNVVEYMRSCMDGISDSGVSRSYNAKCCLGFPIALMSPLETFSSCIWHCAVRHLTFLKNRFLSHRPGRLVSHSSRLCLRGILVSFEHGGEDISFVAAFSLVAHLKDVEYRIARYALNFTAP